MNLNDLPRTRMSDLTVLQQEKIQKLCPILHDFTLFHNDNCPTDILSVGRCDLLS